MDIDIVLQIIQGLSQEQIKDKTMLSVVTRD